MAVLDDAVFQIAHQAGNFLHVFQGLGGQAHHEVEAQLRNPGPADGHRGLGQVIPAQALVQHLAQPVAAGLRGQGDAPDPALGQEPKQLLVDGVGPQGTDADIAAGRQDFAAQFLDLGVIRHRRAHQAHLALLQQTLLDLGPQLCQGPLPGRAVDKPGGAEAAAPGAAPPGLHQEHLAPFALGGQDMTVGRVGGQFR